MPLFDDADCDLLKRWIVRRLEDISDADSDVLADYVLALLRHEQAEDEVKKLCIEQLDDFLREHTKAFCADVFSALQSKCFRLGNTTIGGLSVTLPSNNAPGPPARSVLEEEDGDLRIQSVNKDASELGYRGRKRGFAEQDDSFEDSVPYRPGARTHKVSRRGRADGTRGGGVGRKHTQTTTDRILPFELSSASTGPVPWIPPTTSDSMHAFLHNAQAVAFAYGPGSPSCNPPVKKVQQRCRDYDQKGFCMKGDLCPYEHGMVNGHGEDSEYDPSKMLSLPPASPTLPRRPVRGATRNSHRGGRGGRAEFSAMGPNYDRLNKKLVVEQIPDDKLDEDVVKNFFSEFGTVVNVDMQLSRHLAILEFEEHDMAKRAYDSPAPIFNNRFVKVFWFKTPESGNTISEGQGPVRRQSQPYIEPVPMLREEPEIDYEEIKRIQEEKQKIHEEKTKKKKAAEEAAKDVEKRTAELLKLQAEEKRKLMEKLAKRNAMSTNTNSSMNAGGDNNEKKSKEEEELAKLKAQVARLQEEANILGIVPTEEDEPYEVAASSSWRGRGRFPTSYTTHTYRGRGFVPYFRGRGALTNGRGGGAPSMKLDNRTKMVAVSNLEGKEEEFRHYLINNGIDLEAIDSHPEKAGTLIITFKDRMNAEKFVFSGNEIPNVGAVVMYWYNGPIPTLSKPPPPLPGIDDAEIYISDSDHVKIEADVEVKLDDASFDLAEVADEDDKRWLQD